MTNPFYVYLKTQFTTPQEACAWIYKWYNEDNQQVPGFGSYTIRAMSHHVSLVLEGETESPPEDKWWSTDYLDSKWGAWMYQAIFDKDTKIVEN